MAFYVDDGRVTPRCRCRAPDRCGARAPRAIRSCRSAMLPWSRRWASPSRLAHPSGSFKTELIADRVWRTRSQLELAVVDTSAGSTTPDSTKRSTTDHRQSSNG